MAGVHLHKHLDTYELLPKYLLWRGIRQARDLARLRSASSPYRLSYPGEPLHFNRSGLGTAVAPFFATDCTDLRGGERPAKFVAYSNSLLFLHQTNQNPTNATAVYSTKPCTQKRPKSAKSGTAANIPNRFASEAKLTKLRPKRD